MYYFKLKDNRSFGINSSIVEGDHNSVVIGLAVPKILGGTDLSTPFYNNAEFSFYVKWQNENYEGNTDKCKVNKLPNIDNIEDFEDQDYIFFEWNINELVTSKKGKLLYSISISATGETDYFCWNSIIEELNIENTLEMDNTISIINKGLKQIILTDKITNIKYSLSIENGELKIAKV